MTPVANQPILFTPTGSVNTEACQEVAYQAKTFVSDVLRWQFLVSTCANAEQVIDQPFFESVGSWTTNSQATVFGGGINLCAFSIGGQLFQNNVPDVTGRWYEFSMVISSVAENVGNAKFRVGSLFDSIEFPATVGRHSFFVQATEFNLLSILLMGDESLNIPGFGVCDVTEVTMREIDYPTCEILDENDNVLASPTLSFQEENYVNYEHVLGSDEIEAGQIKIRVFRSCLGDNSDLEDFTSELICIVADNNQDLLIGGCGNVKGYLGDFNPLIRVTGEIVRGTGYQYPNRYTYQNNVGRFYNGHTRRNKVNTLKIELCPDHVRDFIYMLPIFNTIGIRIGTGSQENYFIEEEPDEPVFVDGEKTLATITMRIVRKAADEVSTFEVDCEPSIPPVVIGNAEINEAIQTGNTATPELIKA